MFNRCRNTSGTAKCRRPTLEASPLANSISSHMIAGEIPFSGHWPTILLNVWGTNSLPSGWPIETAFYRTIPMISPGICGPTHLYAIGLYGTGDPDTTPV